MISHLLLLVFPAAMIAAAAWDVTSMKIPNKISLVLLLAFGIAVIAGGVSLEIAQSNLIAGAVVLVCGFAMFSRGLLGGGDAKLLAAASLWIGFSQMMPFLLYVALSGGVLAALMLVYRTRVPAEWVTGPSWLARLHSKEVGIPYGLAIAAGALLVFPKTPLFAALAA